MASTLIKQQFTRLLGHAAESIRLKGLCKLPNNRQ